MESFRSHDGLSIAARLAPGEPAAVFAHATGFCKEIWDPVIATLPPIGVLAIDQRGHGRSEIGSPPFDWWDLGRDVLTAMDQAGWPQAVGIGHSSGAASLVLAELLRPGSFRSLLLIEPILFPPPFVRYEKLPIATAAERRRPSFTSREAARERFRRGGPLTGWVDEALDAYLDHGFEARDDRWWLRCLPEVEAECFRASTLHGGWDRLGEVSCPVVVAGGDESDSHPPAFVDELAARFENGRAEHVPGAGHFLPMERPEAVARLAESLL